MVVLEICFPDFGEMIQFDSYFADGLVQPPTRYEFIWVIPEFLLSGGFPQAGWSTSNCQEKNTAGKGRKASHPYLKKIYLVH